MRVQLPHRGRRAARDPARDRRAVARPFRGLRRAHQRGRRRRSTSTPDQARTGALTMPSRTQPTIGRAPAPTTRSSSGPAPAGAATAMLLGRAGRQRAARRPRRVRHRHAVDARAACAAACMQLHRWGLLDAVRRRGNAADPAHRCSTTATSVSTSRSVSKHGVDALYAPRRTVLDRILVDAARDAGVEVVWGVRVRRPRTRLRTGVSRRRTRDRVRSAKRSRTAPIVIGADGMHSTIARLVDAPTEHETPSASAFIYGYFDGLESDAYDWYFRTRRRARA